MKRTNVFFFFCQDDDTRWAWKAKRFSVIIVSVTVMVTGLIIAIQYLWMSDKEEEARLCVCTFCLCNMCMMMMIMMTMMMDANRFESVMMGNSIILPGYTDVQYTRDSLVRKKKKKKIESS